MSTPKPPLGELYRYLAYGPSDNDPVAAWLDSSDDAALELYSLAAALASEPETDEAGFTELEMIQAIEGAPEVGAERRGLIVAAVLRSREGRELLDAHGFAVSPHAPRQPLPLHDVVARAEQLLARRGREEAFEPVPVFTIALEKVAAAVHDFIRVLTAPPEQLELAAGFRGTEQTAVSRVEALESYYAHGVTLVLAVKRHDNGALGLHLLYRIHHEERELAAATVNGQPMTMIDGEAEAQLRHPPTELDISATTPEGAVYRLRCRIAED